jgi:hypothetical protein
MPADTAASRVAPRDVATVAAAGLDLAAGWSRGGPALAQPFADAAHWLSPPSVVAPPPAPGGASPSTVAPADAAPPAAPSAPTGAGASGALAASGSGTGLVAVLLLALGWLAAQRFLRIVIAPAQSRPVAFVWLLERPG